MNMPKGKESGQVIVILAVALVVLLGFTALAVDGGMIYSDRRSAQNVADSAALAGAAAAGHSMNENGVSGSSFSCSVNGTAWWAAAINAAVASAVQNNVPIDADMSDKNGVEVQECTSSSTPYMDVHVQVTTTTKTSFLQLFMPGGVKNTVEAVARVKPGSSGSMFGGAGIVALRKTGAGFTFNSSQVNIYGGGMFVNSSSTSPAALESNWNPKIYTEGGCIGVVGTVSNEFTPGPWPGRAGEVTGVGFCSPKPAQIDAPNFAAIVPPPPTPPTCTGTGSFNTTTHEATPGNYPSGLTIPYYGGHMQSGTYCFGGPLAVTGGPLLFSGDDVTMVFSGSNGAQLGGNDTMEFDNLTIFTVNGDWTENGSTTVTVPGVFRFYSLGTGDYNVAGGSTETFNDGFIYMTGGTFGWQGSTNINIKGPTSGPYKGLSIYMPITNTNTITIHGGSTVSVTGSIVVPGAYVQFSGSSTAVGLNCQIIADYFTMQGGSIIKINYDPNLNIGSPQAASLQLYK